MGSFYKSGGFYFVLDGYHRVLVSRYHGVEWIDAKVTEFGVLVRRRGNHPIRLQSPYRAYEDRRQEMARGTRERKRA